MLIGPGETSGRPTSFLAAATTTSRRFMIATALVTAQRAERAWERSRRQTMLGGNEPSGQTAHALGLSPKPQQHGATRATRDVRNRFSIRRRGFVTTALGQP